MNMKSIEVQISQDHYLHLRSVGEGGPCVLLLHGWALSGRVWDDFAERFAQRGQGRLLIADLRGAGWSAKPPAGYSLAEYSSDIVAVIDQLGLSELVLVGHSMGGTIAMQVALLRPAALAGLVLVSPVPPSGVPLAAADIAYFRSLGGHIQGAEQVVRMMLGGPVSAAAMQHLVDSAATVSLAAYLGGFDAWRTAAFADQVGQLCTPTVVLGGELEQVISPALLKEYVVARIPGARFVGVPAVGHYPQVEAPEAFAAALLTAIQGLSGRTADTGGAAR
jgi:pimeloyl-ACP methyl ester carboxylesterase